VVDLEGGVSGQECELEESVVDSDILDGELGLWEGRFEVLKERWGIGDAGTSSQVYEKGTLTARGSFLPDDKVSKT
jgi:hypothetical protein